MPCTTRASAAPCGCEAAETEAIAGNPGWLGQPSWHTPWKLKPVVPCTDPRVTIITACPESLLEATQPNEMPPEHRMLLCVQSWVEYMRTTGDSSAVAVSAP